MDTTRSTDARSTGFLQQVWDGWSGQVSLLFICIQASLSTRQILNALTKGVSHTISKFSIFIKD